MRPTGSRARSTSCRSGKAAGRRRRRARCSSADGARAARARAEALAVLADAEETALRALAFDRSNSDSDLEGRGRLLAYHARAQAGDAALLLERYGDASEHYASAAECSPALPEQPPGGEPLARAEVLHNNRSLARGQLGRTAARWRRRGGPWRSTRTTRCSATPRATRCRRAGPRRRTPRARIGRRRFEPSAYPAWNNLGVALARRGARWTRGRRVPRTRSAPATTTRWAGSTSAPRSSSADRCTSSRRRAPSGERCSATARCAIASTSSCSTRTSTHQAGPLQAAPARMGVQPDAGRAPVAAAGFALALLLGLRLTRTLAGQGAASGIGQRRSSPSSSGATACRRPAFPARHGRRRRHHRRVRVAAAAVGRPESRPGWCCWRSAVRC